MMDAFGVALRQSISDHLGHQKETGTIRRMLDAYGQAANLTTIQSRDGSKIYACGMRPDLNIRNPLVWKDFEEHISLQPTTCRSTYHGDGKQNNDENRNHCTIEEVPNLEVRIGNRVARFADADDTMCASLHLGSARFYYIFSNFIAGDNDPIPPIPPTEVVVVVDFTLHPQVVAARNLSMLDMERDAFCAALHPTRFSNNDVVEGSVIFNQVALLPRFPRDDSSEDNTDDEN